MNRLGSYVQIAVGLGLIVTYIPETAWTTAALLATGGFLLAAGTYTIMLDRTDEAEEEERAMNMMAALMALKASTRVIERHDLKDELNDEAESVLDEMNEKAEWARRDPVAAETMGESHYAGFHVEETDE